MMVGYCGLSVAEDLAFCFGKTTLVELPVMKRKSSALGGEIRLGEFASTHQPQDLSGGQKQRVDLAVS